MITLKKEIPKKAREWRNHEAVASWSRQSFLISKESHEAWLANLHTDKTVDVYGIYEDTVGVGVCSLSNIDYIHSKAEFSIYIAPDYHRRGYGKPALEQLLGIAFGEHNLNRVWGEVFVGNPALTVFKKCGFKVEGCLRASFIKYGKKIDSNIIGILKNEYWSSKC